MGAGDYGKTPNVYQPSEVPGPNTGSDLGVGPQPLVGTTTQTSVAQYGYPGSGNTQVRWVILHQAFPHFAVSTTTTQVVDTIVLSPRTVFLHFVVWAELTAGAIAARPFFRISRDNLAGDNVVTASPGATTNVTTPWRWHAWLFRLSPLANAVQAFGNVVYGPTAGQTIIAPTVPNGFYGSPAENATLATLGSYTNQDVYPLSTSPAPYSMNVNVSVDTVTATLTVRRVDVYEPQIFVV